MPPPADASSENIPILRKKALLRLLANHEAERIGVTLSQDDIQFTIDEFRVRNGLTGAKDLSKWLLRTDLSKHEFVKVMCDFALVRRMEEIYDAELGNGVRDQRRIATAHRHSNKHHNTDPSDGSNWIQFNVALSRSARSGARSAAHALFARLNPEIAKWRSEQLIKHFFFVRKPPDVRLRLLVRPLHQAVIASFEEHLVRLTLDGFVEAHFKSVYEPETRQFGGPQAMELVHEYFDADTALWMGLDQLEGDGKRTIQEDRLVTAVQNDLFLRVLPCPYEVWDAWCNLASLLPDSADSGTEDNTVLLLDSLVGSVSEGEKGIVKGYISANQRLAEGLIRTWTSGALRFGLRAVLPFVTMFHFNRHGLNAASQTAIAKAMSNAWNPKRGLRGAATVVAAG